MQSVRQQVRITMNAMLIGLLESYEIFLTLMTVSYQHLHSSKFYQSLTSD